MERGSSIDTRRQLLLESAFAAINYGLKPELAQLVEVLPFVLDSPEDLRLCRAFMLWALDRRGEAANCLGDCDDEDARMLRRVMESASGSRSIS